MKIHAEITLTLESSIIELKALNKEELQLYCSPDNALEKQLGLKALPRELSERVKTSIQTKILPVFERAEQNPLFYTFWLIIDKKEKCFCGELCFKGEANLNAEIELAYASYPDFRNRGYMTEAISLLCRWALQQPGVGAIIAYTDPANLPSIKVLERNGFVLLQEEKDNLKWRKINL